MIPNMNTTPNMNTNTNSNSNRNSNPNMTPNTNSDLTTSDPGEVALSLSPGCGFRRLEFTCIVRLGDQETQLGIYQADRETRRLMFAVTHKT